MVQNLMSAFVIVLAATGLVFFMMLFLQRLARPDERTYTLTVHLQPNHLQNEAIIGYAVQRLRFFGEEKCTQLLVCCDGLSSEEVQMLKNAFAVYDIVRFVGLKDAENADMV
ncbi:MAG: hypothetical protein IKM24_00190 [Clostridia bacterium]|nr:hypothetical protein [Clostridia bacterium]MBR6779423.1 hypothetical protein [Clostridia bacterium]